MGQDGVAEPAALLYHQGVSDAGEDADEPLAPVQQAEADRGQSDRQNGCG